MHVEFRDDFEPPTPPEDGHRAHTVTEKCPFGSACRGWHPEPGIHRGLCCYYHRWQEMIEKFANTFCQIDDAMLAAYVDEKPKETK